MELLMNDRSYLRTLTNYELIELAGKGRDNELALVLAERLEEIRNHYAIEGDDA
jgi:hypothetical protein